MLVKGDPVSGGQTLSLYWDSFEFNLLLFRLMILKVESTRNLLIFATRFAKVSCVSNTN